MTAGGGVNFPPAGAAEFSRERAMHVQRNLGATGKAELDLLEQGSSAHGLEQPSRAVNGWG